MSNGVAIAESLWRQREQVRDARETLVALRERVASEGDLSLGQWAQLFACSLDIEPDLIIELGRGYGNSTCVFTEAANRLGKTRVVSVGYDAEHGWRTRTRPRLEEIVAPQWFDPLQVREMNILELDVPALVGDAETIFLFWDAHGNDVAEFILASALPALHADGRRVVVGVHDMSDARYDSPSREYETEDGLRTYWQGYVVSSFEEVVPLYDFLSRNALEFSTARDSLSVFRDIHAERWSELEAMLADYAGHAPLTDGHWLIFDVPTRDGSEIVFPRAGQALQALGT